MGAIKERLSEMAKRCGDLTPLAQPIRERLQEGNRAVIMAGVSPGSTAKVAPLAASTLKRRKGDGPPRAPMGEGSRVVSGCAVNIITGVGRLEITKSYPTLGRIADYLDEGTPRMPARPFKEFREVDREWIRGQMKAYTRGGGVRGFVGRLFGG